MFRVMEGKRSMREKERPAVDADISIIGFMDIFIIDEYQIDQNIQGATSIHCFYFLPVHTFR